MNETVLQHWGIKGMKWGVRRYQNKDGTLTALGRKREREMNDKLKSANKELKALRAENEQLKKHTSANSRRISELSDDELRQRINRLNMEKQYADIYKQVNPTVDKPHPGKAFAKKILSETIVPAAVNVGKSALEKSLKKALGLEDKPDPSKQLDLEMKKLDYLNKKYDYENKKNPKIDDLADEVKRLENEFKRDEWKQKITKLGKDDEPKTDPLADEVKRLENEWKKKDYEFKISNIGKDDTPVADIIKQYNSMSKEERDAIREAAQVQENINKLKKNN